MIRTLRYPANPVRAGSLFLLSALLATSALTPGGALAANDVWTGAVDNHWENAGNWSSGLPTASSDVTVNVSSPFPFISTVSPTINSLIINGAADPNGVAIIASARTLTVNTSMTIGVAGSNPSAMNVDGHLVVNGVTVLASPGKGYLSINHGGSAQLADVLVGGGGVGANDEGYLIVTNASSLSAGNVYVGDSGTGHMRVTAASAASMSMLTIGNSAGSNGDVLVDGVGSQLTVTAVNLSVGESGSGSLTVQNGGSVGSRGISAGAMSGSVGNIIVTGAGSSMGALAITIGGGGTGTLQVAAGGSVTIADALDVGRVNGGDGTITVTGTGSSLKAGSSGNLGAVTFGLSAGATGRLQVAAGGVADFTSASVTTFGAAAASGVTPAAVGTLSVDGAGSKMLAGDTIIGDGGQGTASVTNGGQIQLANATLTLGNQLGGTGSLTVDGANSQVSAGAVVVSSSGAGIGNVTLSNGGTLTAPVLSFGPYGKLFIGGGLNAPAAAPGILAVSTISSLANTQSGIVFNHTGTFDLTAATSGGFSMYQMAGVTRLSGDGSGYVGSVGVVGGVLIVDSNYSGSAITVAGGTLGGVGTLRNLDLQAGATLNPGGVNNAIGTLHASGSAILEAGSTFKVDVNASGQSDKFVANNGVVINGGQVAVMAAAGNYAPSTQYTILTGTGLLMGTFSGVSSNFAFLTPSLSYDAHNVYLTLTTNGGTGTGGGGNVFLPAAQTPNEIAAATGVNSLGAGNAVYNALLVQSVTWAPAALDQLSGDAHATFGARAVADASIIADGINDRIRGAFDSLGDAMAAYDSGPRASRPAVTPYAFWSQGFGGFGQHMSDWNAGSERQTIAGGMAGVDGAYAIADRLWRFGVAGSYASSSSTIASRNAHAGIETSTLALYGGTQFGALGVRFGTSVAFNGFDTRRIVQFPGFADIVTARYDARTYQLFGEAGYKMRVGFSTFEPFAGLRYVAFDRGAFSEIGGPAAVTADNRLAQVALTSLGLRASHRINAVTLEGSLAWQHGFGDVAVPTTLAFAGGGTPFTVEGVQVRDLALVSAGIRSQLNSATSAGLVYQGRFGPNMEGQSLRADVSVRF